MSIFWVDVIIPDSSVLGPCRPVVLAPVAIWLQPLSREPHRRRGAPASRLSVTPRSLAARRWPPRSRMTAAFRAPWAAFVAVLSMFSAHAINVHPALQQKAFSPTCTDTNDGATGKTGIPCPESEMAASAWCSEGWFFDDDDFTLETMCCLCGGGLSTAETTTTPAPTDVVSGTGDPHLSNLRGEKFDVYQPGNMTLLHLPRLAEPARTLLLVEADARRMGDACSVYFQVLAISGKWTNESKPIQFLANAHGTPEGRNWREWMRFGSIDLKVVHQSKGVDYLNVYARNVGKSGYEVGGLLGLDDHEAVATRPRECAHRHVATLWSSVAAAL